ncbi:formimidoylglutamate deiminase [Oceanibacterium hippocampi]|uniref:8-oxoguanine deaminase n=1 Tax=Oceanibacterium hippocampi TaxID=745714 RepID=A0A1Y5RE77_9PROT|nr:formimidoylglutamate deiminase [Oceanibacterium hippocampi]SLN15158.1 8-oxoguanine deaminase [Oceanibacterium hippocampi]
MTGTARVLFADEALLDGGWARDVRLEVSADGHFSDVRSGAAPDGAEHLRGPVVPGIPNCHSHAFQWAMAGLAEYRARPDDSFWSWRQMMYGFVAALGPEDLEAIATLLYIRMLKAGYTAVAEFHYLHRAPDGSRYADPAEMAQRIAAAAARAGIGLTLLPVLYLRAGADGGPLEARQVRFRCDGELAMEIIAATGDSLKANAGRAGMAPHSLRALPPAALRDALAMLDAFDAAAPRHIHVAEQPAEVEEIQRHLGRRPVAWLLDNHDIDARWCLVHATHMDGDETDGLARSGAIAGLCPTTEANLGDGLFRAVDFMAAGGRMAIGSDSHVGLSPFEELRLLEYGQRLVHGRRNLLMGAADGTGSVGRWMFGEAAANGALATGRPVGRIGPGARADLLVLDAEQPALLGRTGDGLLDAAIFAASAPPVRDVLVGGRWRVRDGVHPDEPAAHAAYATVLRRILPELQS